MSVKIYLNKTGIKVALAQKNRSLSWLSDKVGVSQSYMSRWLSCEKSPRPEVRDKIQKCLGGKTKWGMVFLIKRLTSTSEEF